uniref:BTB domain-containing protein n=1 Tax=Panagrellus redivivus TaxID=6233 RepID=A0A7E4ZQS5_PANRE
MDLKALVDGVFVDPTNPNGRQDTISPTHSIDSEPGDPLTKRLDYFRQNGVGCDVAFVVGEEKEIIKAHKLVLGCSSDVFYAMFFGALANHGLHPITKPPRGILQTAESLESVCSDSECSTTSGECDHDSSEALFPPHKKDVQDVPVSADGLFNGIQLVHVPDIAPTSFRIMVDYIYSNFDVKEIAINEDNVMQTLYAAKKYDIRQLVSACVRYLLHGLTASNAVCLLAQARLFDERILMIRCFEIIDKQTDVALAPENVTEIDRVTLMEILGRSNLDPTSELIVFNAARAWAEAECIRRGMVPVVQNLRDALGPALQLIRFPLMDVFEFGKAASSAVLTCEEVAEVFLHLTVRPRPYCRYPSLFRCAGRSKHIVNRFTSLNPTKRCNRRENRICFTPDRDIFVYGLGVYGFPLPSNKTHISVPEDRVSTVWTSQVEIQLGTMPDPPQYGGASMSSFASNTVYLQGPYGDPTPAIAYFTDPVLCLANNTYVASMRFAGEPTAQTTPTFQGKDGQDSVTINLPYDETVTFKFSGYRNGYSSDDGGKQEGQIPTLHFYCQWPLE